MKTEPTALESAATLLRHALGIIENADEPQAPDITPLARMVEQNRRLQERVDALVAQNTSLAAAAAELRREVERLKLAMMPQPMTPYCWMLGTPTTGDPLPQMPTVTCQTNQPTP